MRDSPWNFEKCLILMKEYDGKKQIQNLFITETNFWVRIHDLLPLMGYNSYTRSMVGNSLGKTIEVDLDDVEIEWGEYMRVRVKMDVTKSLVRKKKLAIRAMEPVWITISYKRLPDFYY